MQREFPPRPLRHPSRLLPILTWTLAMLAPVPGLPGPALATEADAVAPSEFAALAETVDASEPQALSEATVARELEALADAILAAQPEAIRQRVLRGEIVQVEPEGDLAFQALLIFERPIDRVAGLLRQPERQIEFRKDLKQSATLAILENGAVQRQRMRYGFFDFVVHLRYVIDAAGRSIRWSLDDRYENDLRRLDGYWELHPFPSPQIASSQSANSEIANAETGSTRTLASFGSRVELGRFTPWMLQRRATLVDIERVREWVNSEGTWRP